MKKILLSLAFIAYVLTGLCIHPKNTTPRHEQTLKSTSVLPEVMQFSEWIDEDWVVKSKIEFSYNASDQLIETISDTIDNGSWIPVYRNTYEYDPQGNQTKLTNFRVPEPQATPSLKNGIAWEKTSEERMTFDDHGTMTSIEHYFYNEGSEMLYSGERNHPTYDSQSDLLVENWHEVYSLDLNWQIEKKINSFGTLPVHWTQ